jgi:hypothetical protein
VNGSRALPALPAPRHDKTLLEVLYPRVVWRGGSARLRLELRRRLKLGRLPARLPVLTREAVRTELTDLIAQALAVHLSEVAAAGWRRSSRILDAASRTRAKPGATEIVMLGEHTITFTDLPCIEIRVDRTPPARLEVALVVELHVGGIAATIREGRLVELRSDAADVTVALGIGGDRIARRYRTVDLEAVVKAAADGVGLHLFNPPAITRAPDAAARNARREVTANVELDVR